MITTTQPLTELRIARLERLRYRATRHELATINGDRKILVCYASRMSRRGIRAALEGRKERIDAARGPATTASRGSLATGHA
jgi:hypothetical protein